MGVQYDTNAPVAGNATITTTNGCIESKAKNIGGDAKMEFKEE